MLTQVSPLLYAWRTHTRTHIQRHVRSGYTALEIELCTLHIRNVSQATLLTARCALFPSVSSASVWKLPCCRPNLMFLVLYFSPSSSSFHFVSTQQTLTIFTLAACPSSCHSPFSCLAICPSSIIGQTGWQAAVYLFDYHLNRHCRKTFCCAFSKTATPSV